jgi:hypothetical protein
MFNRIATTPTKEYTNGTACFSSVGSEYLKPSLQSGTFYFVGFGHKTF